MAGSLFGKRHWVSLLIIHGEELNGKLKRANIFAYVMHSVDEGSLYQPHELNITNTLRSEKYMYAWRYIKHHVVASDEVQQYLDIQESFIKPNLAETKPI
jgi:UDP-2,3-diacylglucosamine pyrophosphatase LpxH